MSQRSESSEENKNEVAITEMERRIIKLFEVIYHGDVSKIIKTFNNNLQHISLKLFIRLYGHLVLKNTFSEEMFMMMKGPWRALDGLKGVKKLITAVKNQRKSDRKMRAKGTHFDGPTPIPSPKIVKADRVAYKRKFGSSIVVDENAFTTEQQREERR
jgi:hypothetical protein